MVLINLVPNHFVSGPHVYTSKPLGVISDSIRHSDCVVKIPSFYPNIISLLLNDVHTMYTLHNYILMHVSLFSLHRFSNSICGVNS